MKNQTNLLVELNASEAKSINGGLFFPSKGLIIVFPPYKKLPVVRPVVKLY